VLSVDWVKEDVLWLLNPDCVVLPGALSALLKALDESGVEIATPVLVSGDIPPVVDAGARESPIWFGGGRIDVRRGVVEHLHYNEPWRTGKLQDAPVDFVTGAAMMITKQAWDRVGALDERYFLYWEDVDFSLRARRLGCPMMLVSDAVVWHREGGTAVDRGETYWYFMQRNRVLVLRRHGIGPGLTRLVAAVPETLRLLVRACSRPHAFAKLASSLSGLMDGLLGRAGVRGARRQGRVT
jgi:GT2 family glycosyltransferase